MNSLIAHRPAVLRASIRGGEFNQIFPRYLPYYLSYLDAESWIEAQRLAASEDDLEAINLILEHTRHPYSAGLDSSDVGIQHLATAMFQVAVERGFFPLIERLIESIRLSLLGVSATFLNSFMPSEMGASICAAARANQLAVVDYLLGVGFPFRDNREWRFSPENWELLVK